MAPLENSSMSFLHSDSFEGYQLPAKSGFLVLKFSTPFAQITRLPGQAHASRVSFDSCRNGSFLVVYIVSSRYGTAKITIHRFEHPYSLKG